MLSDELSFSYLWGGDLDYLYWVDLKLTPFYEQLRWAFQQYMNWFVTTFKVVKQIQNYLGSVGELTYSYLMPGRDLLLLSSSHTRNTLLTVHLCCVDELTYDYLWWADIDLWLLMTCDWGVVGGGAKNILCLFSFLCRLARMQALWAWPRSTWGLRWRCQCRCSWSSPR